MPTARVDIILCIADRNDSRQISLLMNTCCEFFSWPKFLMQHKYYLSLLLQQGRFQSRRQTLGKKSFLEDNLLSRAK